MQNKIHKVYHSITLALRNWAQGQPKWQHLEENDHSGFLHKHTYILIAKIMWKLWLVANPQHHRVTLKCILAWKSNDELLTIGISGGPHKHGQTVTRPWRTRDEPVTDRDEFITLKLKFELIGNARDEPVTARDSPSDRFLSPSSHPPSLRNAKTPKPIWDQSHATSELDFQLCLGDVWAGKQTS